MLRLILLLPSLCSVANAAELKKFKIKHHEFRWIYKKGGENSFQAKKRTKATYIFPGGYFRPSCKTPIDLIVINGKPVKNYRWDWARPLLNLDNLTIINLKPKEKFIQNGTKEIAALNRWPTHYYDKTPKYVYGVKYGHFYVILYKSRAWTIKNHLNKIGLDTYIFPDDGSSVSPYAKIPVHLGIFKKT